MRKRNILILTAAAVAAISVSGCSQKESVSAPKAPLATMAPVEDQTPADDGAEAAVEALALDDVIDFSYSAPDADMVFKKEDGVWKDGLDGEIPLWQDQFEQMADQFLHLKAISRVENPGELSAYGLDNPPYSLYITDGKKGEVNIEIGSQDTDGNYYARIDESDIYVIKKSTVEALNFNYDSFVVKDTLGISLTAGQIKKAVVAQGEKSTVYKPSNKAAMERIAAGLSSFSPRTFYSYRLTDSDLSYCGLDAANRISATVEFDTGNGPQSATIHIGEFSDLERTYRYVQLDGSQMICDVEAAVLNDILNRDDTAE